MDKEDIKNMLKLIPNGVVVCLEDLKEIYGFPPPPLPAAGNI
jgi:hypothetical protein